MNNIDTFTTEQIETLIEQYFDCTATEQQELQLRNFLMKSSYDSAAAQEARATMGIIAHAKASRRSRHGIVRLHRVASVAAMIAVVLTISFVVAHVHTSANNCVAYVNGQRVSDDDRVISLVQGNLNEMEIAHSDVSESVQQQLLSIGQAIND